MRWVWLVGLLMVLAMAVMPASAETLKVKIHNPNDYDLVDYQVRIDLSGYLDSVSYLKVTDENGNDLKFCYEQDNGECGVNPSFIIWVKVPKIPAKSDAHIYIESSSTNYAVKGNKVFEYYNNLRHDNIDSWLIKKWGSNSGFAEIGDGKLHLKVYKCYNIEAQRDLNYCEAGKYIIEFKWETKSDEWYELPGWELLLNNLVLINKSSEIGGYGSGLPIKHGSHSSGIATSNFIVENKGLLRIVFMIHQSWACSYLDHANTHLWIDWIRVRKYAEIEPTITIEKAQALTPKPKLKLTISCDSTLKQGEIRTAELTVENVGNADAKDIKVAITSPSLGIDIKKDYDLIPSSEARTITFKISPNEAGKFRITAIAEYWDDQGNKYIETTEKVIEVEPVVVPTSTTPMSASTPKSKPPVAIAGDDVTVYEGSEVTLSALSSYDPDGTIVSYQWIDENGVTISNSPILKYSFPVGTHVITLKVTDNDGLSSTDTVKVTVLAKEHGKPSIVISQSSLSGEEGLLTVTIANTGDAKAFDVRVIERIPSEIVVSYVEGATSSGSLITWTGDLDVGEQHNIKHSLKLQTDQAIIPVTVKYKDASGKEYELSTNLIVQKSTQTIAPTTIVTTQTPPTKPQQNKLPISEQTLIILTAIVVVGIVAVAVAIAMMKRKPPEIQIKE